MRSLDLFLSQSSPLSVFPMIEILRTVSKTAICQFLYLRQTHIDVPPLLVGSNDGNMGQQLHSQRY